MLLQDYERFDFFSRFSCVPPSTVKLIPVIVYPLVDGARKTIESCKDNENRVKNKLFSLKPNFSQAFSWMLVSLV